MKLLPVLFACLVLWPLSGLAQAPDPFTSARVHIGPFAVTPTLSVTNVGVDTNVFNEADNPKSDFTATITPAADTWLRFGPARLNVKLSGTYLFFAKYSNQRGLGTSETARLELDLLHVRPWVSGSYLSMRDRPGYEIDLRLRHVETGASGGVDVPFSSRMTFGVSMKRTWTTYESGVDFLGYSVADALNGTTTTGTASFGYDLTPLTKLVVAAEVERDRFARSSLRDTDSVRILPGVQFAATALITGSARVGIRRLTPLTAGVPTFTGVVASVDLGYTLKGVTRFAAAVNRDVAYSYETADPYYVVTGVTGSVSQSVGGPWSVNARAGVQWLAYRAVDPSLLAELGLTPDQVVSGHVDVVRTYGAGIGYKLGSSTFLGVNVDYATRTSSLGYRQYRGLRAGTSVTYGF